VLVNVIGDIFNERDETFLVRLAGPVNATIARGTGIGTITNDDLAAGARIQRFITYISSLGLDQNVRNVLINTLQKAIDDLAVAKTKNACVRLDTFESQVKDFVSAAKIPPALASDLLAELDRIRTVVGCLP
jgi:hypothetical protein